MSLVTTNNKTNAYLCISVRGQRQTDKRPLLEQTPLPCAYIHISPLVAPASASAFFRGRGLLLAYVDQGRGRLDALVAMMHDAGHDDDASMTRRLGTTSLLRAHYIASQKKQAK